VIDETPDNVVPIRRGLEGASCSLTPPPPQRERMPSGEYTLDPRTILEGVVQKCVDAALDAYSDAAQARARGVDASDVHAGANELVAMIAEAFVEIEAIP